LKNLKPAPIISDFADGIKFRGLDKDELLLQPGRKFRVVEHKYDNGKSKIILEEE
jgi:hypothetical protein